MHGDDAVARMERQARDTIANRGATMHCFAAAEGQTVSV